MIFKKNKKNNAVVHNYQDSISDLMSGLVFIFIITIVIFVIKFSNVTEKKNQAISEHNEINKAREALLEELKESLRKLGVKVTIDSKSGILRLPEDALFNVGEDQLSEKGVKAIYTLGKNLKILLDCKTTKISNLCDNDLPKVDSIFIEGHSDEQNLLGRLKLKFKTNLNLSAQRAINTYTLMEDDVGSLKNKQGEFLFSVAGYGSRRPANQRPDNFQNMKTQLKLKLYQEDRRIDLRFVMSIPRILQNVPEIGTSQ
jgi:flagellar motor protein MotB